MHKKPMNGFCHPIHQITASLVSLLRPLGIGEGFFKPMPKRTAISEAEMRSLMRHNDYRAKHDQRLANAAPEQMSRQVKRQIQRKGWHRAMVQGR